MVITGYDEGFENYMDMMNETGFGFAQVWPLLTSGFLVMAVTVELMGMSIIAPASQCDLKTNQIQMTALNCSAFMGVVVSLYFWAVLADSYGRRWVLLVSTSLSTCVSLTSALMPTFPLFIAMRFCVGLFIAGPSFAAITYLAEFCTFYHRRITIIYMAMFQGIAMVYCPVMATLFIHQKWTYDLGFIVYKPWRFLMLLNSLPGLVGIFLLIGLPESPEILLCTQRKQKCINVVKWIYRVNKRKEMDWLVEPEDLSCPGYRIVDKQTCVELMNQGRPLFKKPYVVPFLSSCVVMSGLFFLGNGLGIWFTDLRNRRIDEDLESYTICANMRRFKEFYSELDGCQVTLKSFRDSMFLGATYLIMFNGVALLLRNVSPKIIVVALQILCFLLGGVLPWIAHETATSVIFIIFLAIPNCLIALVSGIVIEFTSADLRGKAVCLCILIGRSGMITGTFLVGYAMDANCELTYTLFGLYALGCSVVSVLLPGKWKCFRLIADQPELRARSMSVLRTRSMARPTQIYDTLIKK
uniref:Major facilitator superfamily (MFS) profile domain-containing protein n=1 Tax=Glossina palpalis gambiensis TaxID=67801 RepID=A0A1B0B2L7_9MUSC